LVSDPVKIISFFYYMVFDTMRMDCITPTRLLEYDCVVMKVLSFEVDDLTRIKWDAFESHLEMKVASSAMA
jgi:hypothetical protein